MDRRLHAERCLGERTAQLEPLEAAISLLEAQLAQAREHIFRLQSPRTDITETEAAEAYSALYANVTRWVQNRLDPILRALSENRLGTPPKPDSEATPPLLGLVREPAHGWLQASESDEAHVIAIIMEFLRSTIFARAFYCPLTDLPEDMAVLFIDEIVENMARLPRGK